MAIELNNRTKILAGVVVLAAVGAGAWVFFLEDFLSEPPPPPKAAAAKAAPKPAATAAKSAPADAAKTADTAKPAGDAAKPAAAAPAAPKPPAKPVPTDPAKVVAEILETSGTKALIQVITRRLRMGNEDPAVAKELDAIVERLYEPVGLLAEASASLLKAYDANRMPRYLELLRQPISQKIVAMEAELFALPEQATKELIEKVDKTPPAKARAKLIARIEELSRLSADIDGTVQRAHVEGMLEYLQTDKKANFVLTQLGDGNPRNARPAMLGKIDSQRGERIRDHVKELNAALRNAGDEELADYLKLIDTEIGEWGATALVGALIPAMAKRMREHGRGFAKILYGGKQETATATAPAKPAAEAPAEKPAAGAPAAAPVEAPGYQRPAGIREVYTRYNDLISATVMRDRAAVKELLDDGKNPNARQRDGFTPLMIAASYGDTEIAAMLLAKGADPNLRAQGGRTALSMAKARGAAGAQMVQLLQRSGAKD